MKLTYEFPERLWKREIEFYNGRARPRVAASSYKQQTAYPMLGDDVNPVDPEIDRKTPPKDERADQPSKRTESEPHVKVSTEAGNAKVTVEVAAVNKEDLSLNCAEDSVTLSVRAPRGPWIKEIRLPFRVDPDTAKAVFRNGKLELIVRRHGKFNPPRPRLDWV